MEVIKLSQKLETSFIGYHCSVYTKTYNHSLEHVLSLFEIAQKDFPELTYQDIRVVLYGGERIKGMMGIEFTVHRSDDCIAGYLAVKHLEYLLA